MSKEENKKESKIIKIKNDLIKAFDENSNSQIDIEDVILKCMRIPGIKIDRGEFLRKEFSNKLSKEVIDKAIAENPMSAKIAPEFIDKIADNVIKFERIQVSGISAVLSAPGGLAAIATIPADIAQYYGYLLRAMQKLLYLYGFPQLDLEYKGALLDSESMRVVVTCLGVMFGVGTANKILHKLASALAEGLGKKITKTAVTKTVWYPALQKICKFFSYSLTKTAFKEAIKKAMPVVGFVLGGTITYFSFGPCCNKLKLQLKDTIFSNPNYIEPIDDNIDSDEEITIELQAEDFEDISSNEAKK
ncbi:MAG: hypothetical protein J6K52_02815 [Clostridia bacterium]|nr:hypothetical protein [Clostridia bacterium]